MRVAIKWLYKHFKGGLHSLCENFVFRLCVLEKRTDVSVPKRDGQWGKAFRP
jgi:hypothetical protein